MPPIPKPHKAKVAKKKARQRPRDYVGMPHQEGGEDIGPVAPLPGEPPPGPPGGGTGGDDYEWLGIGPNVPPEVGAQVDRMLRAGKSPGEVFAYLHGTAWFKQEYAGLDVGVGKSVFTGGLEALGQYRAYKTQVGNAFKAAYGRDMTQAELLGYLGQGYSAGQVGQLTAGHAYAEAQKGDLQYYAGAFGEGQLTQEQLDAYGAQLQGFDSALGQSIRTKVESAMTKAQRVFQGMLGSSALGDQALSQRLQRKPDIGA